MSKITTVRLPPHLADAMQRKAKLDNTSFSALIVLAVEQFVQSKDPLVARLDGIARQIADGNETLAMKLATENRTLLTQLGDLVELIVTNQPGATKPDYTNLRK